MTTEGDVSKISSLADSPTRSITGGDSDQELTSGPPQSSRMLQRRQSDDADEEEDEDAVEASLPSLPSGSSLQEELEADSDAEEDEDQHNSNNDAKTVASAPVSTVDESTLHLASLLPDSDDASGTDLMNDTMPSMATIRRVRSANKTPKPKVTQSAPAQKAHSSNTSPSQRLLPWGKQSPTSRIAKSSAESSSSSGIESSFSVNESFLAREAGKFMNGWKQVEAAERESRPSPLSQARQSEVKASSPPPMKSQTGSIAGAQEQPDTALGESATRVSPCQPSPFPNSPSTHGTSHETPSRANHSMSATITAWQDEVSQHELQTPSKPRSTYPSPAVGLPSTPGSELGRSPSTPGSEIRGNITNDLSFSTAFVSSPAAQAAQRKSLKDLVGAAPLPSSRKSIPRHVSPPASLASPRPVKEEASSPGPSEGAASYNTAKQSPWVRPNDRAYHHATTPRTESSFRTPGRFTPISSLVKRSSSSLSSQSSPSPHALDDVEAAKRLSAVRIAIEEYISAHDERLGTLSSRAMAHQSEASHLRELLHAELDSKCEILQELTNSRAETQEWRRKVEVLQAEGESERALQSQSDAYLRKLVDKMREQLERRAAANQSVKSEPIDSLERDAAQEAEIQQLRGELDRERQRRSREQKDFEIKLAIAQSEHNASRLSASPRSVPLPASRESSPLHDSPARSSQQILEDAVRRARESVEHDYEIRMYTMQRDNDRTLQALEEELNQLRSHLESETAAQAAEYEQRIKELEEEMIDIRQQQQIQADAASQEARQLADSRLTELQELRNASEKKIADLQQRCGDAETLSQQRADSLVELEASLQSEKERVQRSEDEVQELQSQIESLQSERKEIEEDLTAELGRRHQSWTESLQAVEAERDQALDFVAELEEATRALEEEFEQMNAEGRGDSAALEQAKRALAESESTVQELQEKLRDARKELEQWQTQRQNAQAQQDNGPAVQTEAEELRAQLADAEHQRKTDSAAHSRLREANERLEREIHALRASLKEAEQRLGERLQTVDATQATLEQARSMNADQLDTSELVRELEAELKLVRLDLHQCEADRTALNKQLQQTQVRLETTQMRSEMLEKEVGDRGLSVSKLQRANERLEMDIQNHSIALATKQQELSLLKRKFKLTQQVPKLGLGAPSLPSITANESRSTVDEEQSTEILEKGPAPQRSTRRRTIDPVNARFDANVALQKGGADLRTRGMPLAASRAINGASNARVVTALGKRSSPTEPARVTGTTDTSTLMASESIRSASVASSNTKHSTFNDSTAMDANRRSNSLALSNIDMELVRSSSRVSEDGEEEGDVTATSGASHKMNSSKDMSLEELTRLSRNSRSTLDVDGEDDDKENGSLQATPRATTYQSRQQIRRTDSMASISSVGSNASSAAATTASRRNSATKEHRSLHEIPGMESFLARQARQVPKGPIATTRKASVNGSGGERGAVRSRTASRSPELHRNNRSRAMLPA